MIMQQFTDLGGRIDEAWRRVSYDEERFSDIAYEVLSNADLSFKLDLVEVFEWLFALAPKRVDGVDVFGDLPLVVYRDSQFSVSLLVWTSGSTSIHSHAFSGAFRVLSGSSIHSRYDFSLRRRLSSRLKVGDVRLQVIELLEAGDTREIGSGSKLTHALFHLDVPTVSLVVLTLRERWAEPQLTLFPPYLEMDVHKILQDPTMVQLGQCLRVMRKAGDARLFDSLLGLISRLDPDRLYHLSTWGADIVGSQGAQILETIREHHGDFAECIHACRTHQNELQRIKKLSDSVSDGGLRFFLGTLACAPSQPNIYALIRSRYPQANPEDKVVEWLTALAVREHISIQAGPIMLRGKLRELTLDETITQFGGLDDLPDASWERETVASSWAQLDRESVLSRLWNRG